MRLASSKGFSLLETIVSLGVLTTGVLGAAAVLAAGMQNLSSSPSDVVTTHSPATRASATNDAPSAVRSWYSRGSHSTWVTST